VKPERLKGEGVGRFSAEYSKRNRRYPYPLELNAVSSVGAEDWVYGGAFGFREHSKSSESEGL
jgi:hypothetical protein